MTEAATGEWEFLQEIYSILRDGGVLNTQQSEPIVRFRHPVELKELFDFTFDTAPPTTDATEMLAAPVDLAAVRSICEQVIRYSVKTGHPQFHNQLFGAVDPLGLAGSWITEALNTSQYTYEVAPIFTLMENQLLQQFCTLFGYPAGDGIFAPGGSISNMYAMMLARQQAVDVKRCGLFGQQPLVAFTSAEAHYSCKKAASWLGIGTDNLCIVRCDQRGRMLAADLEQQIAECRRQQRRPFFVNATAGTTVQGSFDPLPELAAICERERLWLHVDACLGGSVVVVRDEAEAAGRGAGLHPLLAGIERSDSLAWNPHKALGVPLQCAMLLVRQRGRLLEANSTQAQYLFQPDKFYDVAYDTGDKSVQCGRKVDVFKFWLMLKARGLRGLGARMRNAMELARYLEAEVRRRSGFRLLPGNSASEEGFDFTNVCFWYVPKRLRRDGPEEEDEDWWQQVYRVAPAIKKRMCGEGTVMVGYSPLSHRGVGNFLRMVVACYPVAGREQMDFVLDEIERLGEEV